MDPAFTYEIVASELHDPAQLAKATDQIIADLHSLDGVGAAAPLETEKPAVIVVGTGGTEATILDRWRQRQAAGNHEPMLLVAIPTDNSLPAALEALARIHQDGGRGHIVMAGDREAVATAIDDLLAASEMRSLRIGVVGEPSDWLVASTADAAAVRTRWGPELVPVDIAPVAAAGASPTATAVALGQRWADQHGAGSPGSVATEPMIPTDELMRAAALHPAMTEAIEQNHLDAITVRCFDLLDAMATSGCLALAELNQHGIVAGCEGDIASVVGMAWVRCLLGATSWMANPATVDPDRGEIVLAHCTVAPSLVDDVELTTHFESGLGVGLRGRFRRQPVTLVRLGGRELDQRWIVDGQVISAGADPHLCRTQATVVVDRAAARELMDHPLGNHIVLVPGHHADRLDTWWRRFVGE